MFDTNIVVIGNVLTAPEWRRTTSSNALVTNFRVASTARRMDRESGRWVDGNHLRVRVSCWRRLAEGVASSVTVGDPVVVSGRLFTRDWTDAEGNLRTSYEMEATAVGHDLSRGKAKFFRNKSAVTTEVESPEVLEKVRGESAAVVSEEDLPAVYGEGLPAVGEPTYEELPIPALESVGAPAAPKGGGLEPFDTSMTVSSALPAEEPHEEPEQDRPESEEPGRDKESEPAAEPSSAPIVPEGRQGTDFPAEPLPAPRRVRGRNPRRQPVAA